MSRDSLKGKVVLIDFWTYSCINCLRSLPYVRAWSEKYKGSGLVVIGVHTPEFAFEKNPTNVQKAVRDLGITYAVAIDSNFTIWNAFDNHYWPAHYFIDKTGKIRHTHFGEGEYEESEKILQGLLAEAGGAKIPAGHVQVRGEGALASGSGKGVTSPETYIGSSRAENRVTLPKTLELNQWGMVGHWNVEPERAVLSGVSGKIVYRFHARDLHLVLGPGSKGRRISFVVRLDGQTPGKDRGADIDASGRGIVEEHRLYQLIRQSDSGDLRDRTFEIEFLAPGVEAFAFTFG